jgi:hypothetical protein
MGAFTWLWCALKYMYSKRHLLQCMASSNNRIIHGESVYDSLTNMFRPVRILNERFPK